MRRALLIASLALVLSTVVGVAPAAAAPPTAGLLVPGKTLGGLRLGATRGEVERAWGRAYGVCAGCARETWYFNYFAFQPRGAGVELRGGHVAAIFTVYSPPAWHTPKGLAIADPVADVTALYGALKRVECSGYYALLLPRLRSLTAFYILHDRVWAFGLSRLGHPVCR